MVHVFTIPAGYSLKVSFDYINTNDDTWRMHFPVRKGIFEITPTNTKDKIYILRNIGRESAYYTAPSGSSAVIYSAENQMTAYEYRGIDTKTIERGGKAVVSVPAESVPADGSVPITSSENVMITPSDDPPPFKTVYPEKGETYKITNTSTYDRELFIAGVFDFDSYDAGGTTKLSSDDSWAWRYAAEHLTLEPGESTYCTAWNEYSWLAALSFDFTFEKVEEDVFEKTAIKEGESYEFIARQGGSHVAVCVSDGALLDQVVCDEDEQPYSFKPNVSEVSLFDQYNERVHAQYTVVLRRDYGLYAAPLRYGQ